jgi:hypothetical protein
MRPQPGASSSPELAVSIFVSLGGGPAAPTDIAAVTRVRGPRKRRGIVIVYMLLLLHERIALQAAP